MQKVDVEGETRGRKKLPEDPRRHKQVSTFLKNHGREKYAAAGREGAKKTSGSFTSKTASKASKIRWEKERARRAAER